MLRNWGLVGFGSAGETQLLPAGERGSDFQPPFPSAHRCSEVESLCQSQVNVIVNENGCGNVDVDGNDGEDVNENGGEENENVGGYGSVNGGEDLAGFDGGDVCHVVVHLCEL